MHLPRHTATAQKIGNPPKIEDQPKIDDEFNYNAADIEYQVGMNRTKTGQKSTINRLYDAGKISEAQANALYDKFKIDS